VAYSSCEYAGQPMFLNYSSPSKLTNLYHLVFMGEEGSGEIQFMLKNQFSNESLSQILAPKTAFAGNTTEISYSSISNSLERATCYYTVNNWTTLTSVSMSVINNTCSATIPSQAAGSIVKYKIEALDSLRNVLTTSGNYSVKMASSLDFAITNEKIQLGENITASGFLSPATNVSVVRLDVFGINFNETISCKIEPDGSFEATFRPPHSGNYSITATALETPISFRSDSSGFIFSVAEPPLYIKYSILIIGVIVAVSVVGGLLYYFKFRGR